MKEMTKLRFLFLSIATLLGLVLSVSGCGPEDTELTVPMILYDVKITEIRSTGTTVTWSSNLEATSQVDWFYVPITAFQEGLSLQDLLRQPGVTISNSAVSTQSMKRLHSFRIDGLEPGGWYALRVSASNQRGARASTLGWNLVLNTFSDVAGPPAIVGVTLTGDRVSIGVGDS